MDKNFISVFRSIPLWPNDLIPLDAIFHRLLKTLTIPPETAANFDPVLLIGGILGFRDIKIHRFDGVTTVTGQIVLSTELCLAPLQSYVGIVIGDPSAGTTGFPFSLRIKDEPPIKNSDEIFEIGENTVDPQLGAFQPVEKNPEAGFFDVESWRVSLRNIPAKIRILKGVTRVELIVENDPTRGFRKLTNEHVDVGITLSLDFDANGELKLWPPDPGFHGAEEDPVGALDLDLGWFHINESPLYLIAQGIGYHRPNTHFPTGSQPPTGLDESWSGFFAQTIGGFWWKEPINDEEEVHVYGLTFKDLLIGNEVFAVRGSFEHGGGTEDPFNSPFPVEEDDLPSSRWSLRKIEVFVAEGAGDILQISGKCVVAAILGFFKNQPVKFDVSIGRILKEIEIAGPDPDVPIKLTLPVVQLVGALTQVQNHTQLTPDGRLRMPMFEAATEEFSFQINGARFELIFPGGTVPGVDIPTRLKLQMDLGIEIGNVAEEGEGVEPVFEAEVPGLGFEYPAATGILGTDFRVIAEGAFVETKISGLSLMLFGYELSISRVGFAFGAGETDAWWLSFDAHIQFPDALGRATVFGLRFGWDNNGLVKSIEGIGVEVKKPGFEAVGILKFLTGPSSFVPVGAEPITIQEGSIAGFVRLAFPGAGTPLAFEVGLMHGKYEVNSSHAIHSFWMLTAELVFPFGLPLGLADLAFYGLAIAVGNNVTPRKPPTTSWFDWYSKELPRFSVIAPTKWTAAHDRFAFGLGVICGSSVRSGYPHNERLLGIYNSSAGQGSTWLFEGKVRFLKEVTKPGDPNIAILVVIAPDQILMRAEFHFSFPEAGAGSVIAKGLVMTARGMIEIFIDRTGAGRHHICLGRHQPYSERINASVLLGFFTSRAFYMLDWADLALSNITLPPLAMAFGFAQGWNWNKKFGPLRLYLEANIEFEVGFSFVSVLYGYLRVYGGLGFRIWGFGFGLSIDAAFTLFISNSWKLTGTIKVKLNLPWPIPDYRDTLEIDLGPGAAPPPPLVSPLRQLALSSPSFDGNAPLHDWSENNVLGVPPDFKAENSQLAVDGAIVLAFRAPSGKRVTWISGVDTQPVDGSGEWQFRYTVEDVILRRKRPGATTFEPVPNPFKKGFWEITGTTAATSSAPTTGGAPLSQVISIWGETPGEQLRNLGNLERSGSITWMDGFLDFYGTWPCGPDAVMDLACLHFDLNSFRLLDGLNTRVTVLPGGTMIRSRPGLDANQLPDESGSFVVLDEVIPNPRPNFWGDHENVLSLPYLYKTALERPDIGFLPFSSALEVDLPPSTFVQLILIGVFSEELLTVEGLHDGQVVVLESKTGADLHEVTLNQPDPELAITRVRISSLTNLGEQTPDDAHVSCLGQICYRTSAQSELQKHIIQQRESLNQLIEVLDVPPGLPGQNADHFNLHAQGTVYEVTPVVTCERKGPETNWEVIHNHLSLAAATVTVGPPPKDLTPYLAETIPARDQDPVFLGDDMQLRFNRSYGPEMYTVSGFDFRVEVLDAQRQPVPITTELTFSEEPALSPAQELLLEALLSSPCVTADITAVRKKLVTTLRPILLPRTYYYLVIRSSAHPNLSLYEAPFMTSRYKSWDEQFTELEANHVHELLPGPTNLGLLESLLAKLPAPTREDEQLLFEKIWEDALGFGQRERPARGELVVFYEQGETGPGAPRVIMMDSPEPLLIDQRTGFRVEGPNGLLPLAVRNLDGSRALLFVLSGDTVGDFPKGDFVFSARYRRQVEGLPTQRINGASLTSSLSITLSVSPEAQISLEVL